MTLTVTMTTSQLCAPPHFSDVHPVYSDISNPTLLFRSIQTVKELFVLDKRKGKSIKSAGGIEVGNAYKLDTLFEISYRAKMAEGRAENTLDSYRGSYRYFI